MLHQSITLQSEAVADAAMLLYAVPGVRQDCGLAEPSVLQLAVQ